MPQAPWGPQECVSSQSNLAQLCSARKALHSASCLYMRHRMCAGTWNCGGELLGQGSGENLGRGGALSPRQHGSHASPSGLTWAPLEMCMPFGGALHKSDAESDAIVISWLLITGRSKRDDQTLRAWSFGHLHQEAATLPSPGNHQVIPCRIPGGRDRCMCSKAG